MLTEEGESISRGKNSEVFIFFRSRQSFTRSKTIASLKFLSALNFMSEKLSFSHFKTLELQFNAQQVSPLHEF